MSLDKHANDPVAAHKLLLYFLIIKQRRGLPSYNAAQDVNELAH